MSDYNNPRPLQNASASDPCTIVDNAISFDKVINGDSTVTTYTGKQILSLSQAIDKFGFGVAPFTFTTGGTLQSKNLLVSNDPVDGFLYKYVGSGSFPLTVTAGTNPNAGSDWQQFAATDRASISSLIESQLSDLEKSIGKNYRIYPFDSTLSVGVGDNIPASSSDGMPITNLIFNGNVYFINPLSSGLVSAINDSEAIIGGITVELTSVSDFYSKRLEAPYVITVNKSEIQQAIDKAAASTKPYPQINGSSNSGGLIIDLGGRAILTDRPIELPAGAGGYSIQNGLIAPNVGQFPAGENLIEYVGVGDHPFIGFQNLQLECSRIANGMYVNRYIENWALGLRIHGQKDWGVRIGSDLGFEFNMGTGCTISEYYNNEAGYLSPTSIGLLIDVGGAADNKFNSLVVKYCKRQFDIGSQANKFNACHFYGTGADQYNNNGRSIIRGNAKRNQFNGTYFDTCGLEIINPSQMQILGGRFAAASSVNGSSYVHLNAITASHNLDALLIKDNLFSIIGDYQAQAFSWAGTIGRVRDTDVSNNSCDLQGNIGENPSIKMHSTKAYKRAFASGINQLTASFSDVLLWNASIQRLIDSEVELNNIQAHNTQFSGSNVTVTLPAGQTSNITLRTSVDASSRYSQIADQYPL